MKERVIEASLECRYLGWGNQKQVGSRKSEVKNGFKPLTLVMWY